MSLFAAVTFWIAQGCLACGVEYAACQHYGAAAPCCAGCTHGRAVTFAEVLAR